MKAKWVTIATWPLTKHVRYSTGNKFSVFQSRQIIQNKTSGFVYVFTRLFSTRQLSHVFKLHPIQLKNCIQKIWALQLKAKWVTIATWPLTKHVRYSTGNKFSVFQSRQIIQNKTSGFVYVFTRLFSTRQLSHVFKLHT